MLNVRLWLLAVLATLLPFCASATDSGEHHETWLRVIQGISFVAALIVVSLAIWGLRMGF